MRLTLALAATLSLTYVSQSYAVSSIGTSLPTRYGVVSSDAENKLTFAGRLVEPVLQGNNALVFNVKAIRYGEYDLVIVEDDGGSSCPAMFSIVELGSKRVSGVYGEFGTCSDLIKVHPLFNGKLTMTMPDYESYEAQRHHAPKRVITHKYVFSDGRITENGQLIKNDLPTY